MRSFSTRNLKIRSCLTLMTNFFGNLETWVDVGDATNVLDLGRIQFL